jgi:YD repeat-containing protein
MEIRAEKHDPDGRLVAEETRALTMRSYPRDELRRLLERTGLQPRDEYPSAPDPSIVVWLATA